MKQIFNTRLFLLLAIIIAIAGSCEKGPQFRKFTYPPQPTSGISPATGFPGSYVTITGNNFDSLTGAVKVWFGGILADSVISSNGSQIVVKVPDNAASGKVSLQVWTNTEDSIGTFTVVPAPTYSTISTTRAKAGEVVTITGQNFGTDASNVKVLIVLQKLRSYPFLMHKFNLKFLMFHQAHLFWHLVLFRLPVRHFLLGMKK
jgi:hypothetical protein